MTVPDVFDQTVRGNHLVHGHEQPREQRALPRTAERERAATGMRFERPEHEKLELVAVGHRPFSRR